MHRRCNVIYAYFCGMKTIYKETLIGAARERVDLYMKMILKGYSLV